MALAFLSWPFLGPVGAVGILYCHIANTIRVVAPLGTLNYLNYALENGCLVKDGHVLEELNNIDAIVFDKTGTLTQALAESLGINDYFYEVLPEEKSKIVEKLQKEGKKVAFVGDGVNDTLAMEQADISISLSGASTIATDVAQVVLMDGSLMHITDLIDLSKKLEKNLSRSLILSIVPNAIALNGVLFLNFGMISTMLLSQSPLVFGTINAFFKPYNEARNLLSLKEKAHL